MNRFHILGILAFSLLLLATSACNNNSFKKEIKTCDSLIVVLKVNDSILSTVDSVQFMNIKKEVGDVIMAVENHYKKTRDTMSKKHAFLMSDYRLVFKGVKRFDQNYQKYTEEVEFSLSQLNTLKTDLNNNALTKPLAKRFLSEEYKVVSELTLNISGFNAMNKSTYDKYLVQKPVMEQFLDSLNNSIPTEK